MLVFIVDSDISCRIQEKVADGETSAIDQRFYSRSFGENSLIDIILKCWVFNPDERIGINELQELLEEAVAVDEHLAKNNYAGWYYEQPTDWDSNSNRYPEEEGNHEDSHSDSESTSEEEAHHDGSPKDKTRVPWMKTIEEKAPTTTKRVPRRNAMTGKTFKTQVAQMGSPRAKTRVSATIAHFRGQNGNVDAK
jgi:hypothetical protein